MLALHGGTAINLYYENLPRLSVDIDLTYIPIENRKTSLKNISNALKRIASKLKLYNPTFIIEVKEEISKIIIGYENVFIKVEVNQTKRGILEPSTIMPICLKAREIYNTYSEIQVVEKGLLYGGKICAALDRQHPRDLFDCRILLDSEGITSNIKEGLFLCLLSSDRPISEILFPNLIDQSYTLKNKFEGMTEISFSYFDFENTRENLLRNIYASINEEEINFLIDFERGEPNWNLYDFSRFPGVQWKLLNTQKLKTSNPKKHKKLVEEFIEKYTKIKTE